MRHSRNRPISRRTFLKAAGVAASATGAASVPVLAARAPQPGGCDATVGVISTIAVSSKIYGGSVATRVYLPPCYASIKQAMPVIYLLHGAGADETQWPDLNARQSADAVIAATKRPFLVVMPGGEYGGPDYSAFVLNDLLPAIEKAYRVIPDRCGRALGGLSMGGYWALKTAFEHPELFAATGGHSPVVSNQPLALARTGTSLEMLRITLDVGDHDALRAGTEQLALTLRARRVPVTLAVNAGAHNRAYWRAHSLDYLRFYAGSLARAACAPANPASALNYLLQLPRDYASTPAKRYPLILYLHGASESGDELAWLFRYGPPKFVRDHPDAPFIVVSPQAPFSMGWRAYMKDVRQLLNDIETTFRVDPRRLYLTGQSMGGNGTWELARQLPERFAAIVPVASFFNSDTNDLCALKQTAIWVIHGIDDELIPSEGTMRIVKDLQDCGLKPKVTVMPDSDHVETNAIYDGPKFYEWLLAQSLPKKS